jgi:hypothetical protein
MVGVLHRLCGLPEGGVSYAVVYALLAGATVAGAVYGYRVLLAMSRVLAIGVTALLVVGVIAYAPHFTTSPLPETGGYLLGGCPTHSARRGGPPLERSRERGNLRTRPFRPKRGSGGAAPSRDAGRVLSPPPAPAGTRSRRMPASGP